MLLESNYRNCIKDSLDLSNTVCLFALLDPEQRDAFKKKGPMFIDWEFRFRLVHKVRNAFFRRSVISSHVQKWSNFFSSKIDQVYFSDGKYIFVAIKLNLKY